MKPFNLEEALAGKYCVTRDGKQAIVMLDKSKVFPDASHPLIGYVKYIPSDNWYNSEILWTLEGYFKNKHKKDDLDLIGMWEEPPPEVTITVPAPLNKATEGQEVWYLNYEPFNLDGHDVYRTCAAVRKFRIKDGYLNHLLEIGQLFATKEDAQAWLDAMKGAKR